MARMPSKQNGGIMTAPITSKIEYLFHAHGVKHSQHQGLVADLMRLVYDEKEKAVDEVLGSPFDAKAAAFAEQIDKLQSDIRDDIHGIYLDSSRAKEDNNA